MRIHPALLAAAALAVTASAVRPAAAQTAPAPAPVAGTVVDSSASPAAAALAAHSARPARVRRDLITAEQAQAVTGARNAYEVVERLHPNWLRQHATEATSRGGASGVAVFYEGREIGNVNALRDMPVAQIVTMQYYDGIAASSLFGPDHDQGAIVVTAH